MTQEEEFYMCIYATREGDHVLFHHEGGVEVGDVDSKAQRLMVAVGDKLSEDQVTQQLLTHVPDEKKEYVYTTALPLKVNSERPCTVNLYIC